MQHTCRAKFSVCRVAELGYDGKRQEIMKRVEATDGHPAGYESTGVPIREITLTAVYDSGICKENKSFADATPSGTITFCLNNPALAEASKPGQAFYVDFTPAA